MQHKIFEYIKTDKIADMFMINKWVVYNWANERTHIPPEIEAEMTRIVDLIET